MGINIGDIAIMALPMMLIVVTGEIDLSVASTLGLAGALLGDLWQHGWAICRWRIVAALVVGVVGGALNGVLVAKAGAALHRGDDRHPDALPGDRRDHARVADHPRCGDRSFPAWFTKIGVVPVPGHTCRTRR